MEKSSAEFPIMVRDEDGGPIAGGAHDDSV
jgi:hypothetical protein